MVGPRNDFIAERPSEAASRSDTQVRKPPLGALGAVVFQRVHLRDYTCAPPPFREGAEGWATRIRSPCEHLCVKQFLETNEIDQKNYAKSMREKCATNMKNHETLSQNGSQNQ